MNKAKLKAYAPQARKDFIAAVTARAQRLGLLKANGQFLIAPAELAGDLVIIAGQSWPAKISRQRDKLIELINQDGYQQTLEAVAYTWFNRFAALRYMEIHDYLNHGYRVLSSREGGLPEILNAATDLAQNGELPSLNAQKVKELKLAGDQDGELYRLTLIAQCNALSSAIPFLFERIDDETELLLPDNLLLTDSVIAKLVAAIPEEYWSQVEIVGWLYQFYISEKKDQVIGKVVKSEDIPAATQLFTPNWIVQYLVQNSVGRLWLMANPASTLKSQWPYYIEPAEQTPEVQAQLDALIQTRMAEDGGSLNPETLTVLDPACGSGHILVEAYEVLKAIYLERGYQLRSIPRLILEKNLFGLDIDDRAAQLAGFALLMKARADDRRLLDNPPKLNVLALQDSKGLDADELVQALKSVRAEPVEAQLINTFAHAKTFGSLIQITQELNEKLAAMEEALQQALRSEDLFTQAAAFDLLPLVHQARILGMRFDVVVANPPYMGGKGMNTALKEYAKRTFPDSKSDLFAMFIERGFEWCKPTGFNSMVTMQSWMFLSSFEGMREKLLADRTIITMAHLGARAFSEISGEVVQTTAFVLLDKHFKDYRPVFFRLVDGQEDQKETALRNGENRFDATAQDDFKKVPGCPTAYWVRPSSMRIFEKSGSLNQIAEGKSGMSSCNSDLFLRKWYEVSANRTAFFVSSHEDANNSGAKWFCYNKGGGGRKWYGYNDILINWEKDGYDIKKFVVSNPKDPDTTHWSRRLFNLDCFFKKGISWSAVSSANFAARIICENGVIPGTGSKTLYEFDGKIDTYVLLGFLNSVVAANYLKVFSPTLNFEAGDVGKLPILKFKKKCVLKINTTVEELINLSRTDWNGVETSSDFCKLAIVNTNSDKLNLESSWSNWKSSCDTAISRMHTLEVENNSLFIEAYSLQDELSPEVPEDQITLTRADREKDCQRLISYAIGCIMGRYSLNEPGLIYAQAGNIGFNPGRYNTFPADADGIVPITDELWFEDDAANRIREFLLAVWDSPSPQPSPQGEGVEANMAWLAESLGQRGDETPGATIRRYIASSFFKDHLQTYKKRPIYWLFSSGKQGAFQALVYLHRYHEGTLSRMRTEYVVPLMGKLQSRLDMLAKDAASADSNAARNKLNKDIEKLKKKHVELLAYDEKLRHYADLRIHLDLDDGVKVNYGKFGDLLAEVKAVTGGSADE